jgi:hypothetical protein
MLPSTGPDLVEDAHSVLEKEIKQLALVIIESGIWRD